MKLLELLAPAKDLQTGIAAITHGADAVYIAAEKFGAREKAGNSIENIKELVNFAHQYFARVYVTVNTILYDNELEDAKELIHALYNAHVDAIIIQDFAILSMDIPPIAIHASTQMHNISPEKVKFLEHCGIERIVLPRELSIQEIEPFRQSTTAELEFFIHGALCVCYSGQCYLSQAITDRSANRGACAQPCRSAYDLIDADGNVLIKNKHLLSLKDLNLSQHIHQLIDAGISSFKIEGRMKDISYVKNTVTCYSNTINSIISNRNEYKRLSSGKCEYTFTPDPEKSFNRGFSKHFIEGRTTNQASYHSQKSIGKLIGRIGEVNSNWFSIDSNEKIHNGDGLCYFNENGELNGFLVNSSIQGKIYPNKPQEDLVPGIPIYRNADHAFEKQMQGKTATRYISLSLSVEQKNDQLTLTVIDEDNITSSLSIDDAFEDAQNPTLTTNNLINQLGKTGETIFRIEAFNVSNMPNPKHVPISKLNAIRRDLLEIHRENRIKSYRINIRKPEEQAKYPQTEIDFKGNVANTLSKNFLLSHGVKKMEKAFELEQTKDIAELMVTRYCLKYELGLCPLKQNAKPTKPLYLRDNNYTYPLVFDCKNCQMKVMSPNKNRNL
ncbi:collagenase [Tenuifilaceae bacterium CYCD]|nr:collagenase [Tenuifilaceae bacterium CYCD]